MSALHKCFVEAKADSADIRGAKLGAPVSRICAGDTGGQQRCNLVVLSQHRQRLCIG